MSFLCRKILGRLAATKGHWRLYPVRPALILTGLLLSACAAPSTTLMNDRGQRAHCRSSGFGVVGTAIALGSYQHCMSSHKAVGYRVPGSSRSAEPRENAESALARPAASHAAAPVAASLTPIVVSSPDKRLGIALPAGWTPATPPSPFPHAQIFAQNPSTEGALAVTAESRADVTDLVKYGETVRDAASAALAGVRASEVRTDMVNGRRAVRFDVAGESNGLRVRLLFTLIEGSRVLKLVAWTTESRFAASRREFEALAEGLSEAASLARAD